LPLLMAAGVVGLVLLLALGAIVRMWGTKLQRHRGPTGGIDLAALKRMRDDGEITAEEFDRVSGQIAGTPAAPPPTEPPPAEPQA